jgi:hypothetical protein
MQLTLSTTKTKATPKGKGENGIFRNFCTYEVKVSMPMTLAVENYVHDCIRVAVSNVTIPVTLK